MIPIRLITLAPGHFHAALIQKVMQPGIDPHCHVFGPLDDDLVSHLSRIAAFNRRPLSPTAWTLDVRAGADWLERLRREKPGNVVVLSGRNRQKIDLMQVAVEAGMHVLADKPWIIEPDDLAKLAATLATATRAGLLVHDVMTERFEITSILQRALVNDTDVFGAVESEGANRPAMSMASVHYLKKQVSGVPLRRPGWFFDIREEGEALADVGVHLVDQVLWMLFVKEPIDYEKDIQIVGARRWPTVLDATQFGAITGLGALPPELHGWLRGGRLEYYCNNRVDFKVRDVHVRLDVLWDYEAPPGGGDTHNAALHGTRSSVFIRQSGGMAPELFIAPKRETRNAVYERLSHLVASWQAQYSGLQLTSAGDELHISIPVALRTGHEAHFGEVVSEFLKYVAAPGTVPKWELPHLLAKYFVTTHGVARARERAD